MSGKVRRHGWLLALAVAVLVAPGCKKPEEKIAVHAEALTEIFEDNEDDPKDGVETLREYMRDNLPEIARSVAELAVEIDAIDSRRDRKERVEEIMDVLEKPLTKLLEAAMDFRDAGRGDSDAQEAAREVEETWEEIAEALMEAMEGGDDGGMSTRRRRGATTEAIDGLDKMYKSASYYYTAPRVESGTGRKIDCQFPASQAMTPDVTGRKCCGGIHDADGDNKCDVNTVLWTTPTWSALNFQMNDQHYFGYAFESSGVLAAARFTASAYADLDCDGTLSTFERYGYGDASASHAECSMKGSSAFYKHNELE